MLLVRDVYTKYILLLVFLTFSSGCNDVAFLDKKPLSTITEANYFKNETHAKSVLSSAYDVLQWEFDEGKSGSWYFHNLFLFGDICSDDADKGAQNASDGASVLALSNFEGQSNAADLRAVWNINYTGIARANIAIENISKMSPELFEGDNDTIRIKKRQRYIAEAKFLRAFYYFNLVKMFGGVVLSTKIFSPSEYNTPRSTEEETWDLIEKDLQEAADALPMKSEYDKADYGRATKGAALAYLAKAHAFQGDWEKAKEASSQVVSSGEYSLVDDYQSVFEPDQEHGSGSIFEINFTHKLGGGWPPNGSEGNTLHTFLRSRDEGMFGEGWGWDVPTQNLYDAFETNDARREATIISNDDEIYGVIAKNTYKYHSRKFRLTPETEPSELGLIGDELYQGGQNLRLFRYADLLLFHAEACAKTDDDAGARTYLNMVRERARAFSVMKNPDLANDPTLLPARTSSGEELLQHIWHERRVELAMEGHRFFDIVRQGRAQEILHAFGKTNYEDEVHRRFGIPSYTVQITNGAVKQNPGWE